ncbi:MAG: hypothetical protein KDD62_10590, partial [Bdellovibrionales bacterium]|nr:hypothetical protein [Bdellovibrionales bacterium]
MSKQDDKDSKLSDEQLSNTPSASGTTSPVGYGYSKGYGYGYGYGYSAGSSGSERSLKDYPLILLRYWPLILCLTLLSMGIAVYKTKRTPRIYQSSSMIDIGVYVPITDGPTSTQLEQDTRRANYINTQTSLLKSLTMAQMVLQKNPDILEYVSKGLPAEFSPALLTTAKQSTEQKLPVNLLQAYINTVSFQKLDGTSLVRIFANTRNADMSSRIANGHAEGFIALVKDRREKAARLNEKFLREELKEATHKLTSLEKKRIEHAKSNSLIASGSSILEKTYESKFQGLAENLNDAIDTRVLDESRYRRLKSRAGNTILNGGNNQTIETEVHRL